MADMNVASNQAGIFPKKLTPIHQEALDKIEGEGGNKKKLILKLKLINLLII